MSGRAWQDEERDEPPPFGGSWRLAYGVVIGGCLFWVVAFWLFSRAFAS